jgi:hypothetical protein
MPRYKIHFEDGSEAGEAAYALPVEPGELIHLGLGTALENGALTVAPDLGSASLHTTFEGTELVSGQPATVEVNVGWSATGPLDVSPLHFHTVFFDGLIVNGFSNGRSRPTTAAGTVTMAGTNFTPEPAFSSSVLSATAGQVMIEAP